MNVIISQAIVLLAHLILGSDVFTRIKGAVERWEEKALAGIEKKTGVLHELETIGIELAKSEANLGIELAVAYFKNKSA